MNSPVVWGRFIRAIHWIVAGGVLFNQFVLEEGDPPHRWLGYLIAALVFGRVFWGLAARNQVSFRFWPLRPSDLKTFLKSHFFRIDHTYPAHNPLASYVYLAVWTLILALALTGWMMGLDAFWGDEWLEDLHGTLADGLMALVLLHLIGIGVDSYLFKRKTWLLMITGKSK